VRDALQLALTRSPDASIWSIRLEPRLQWRFAALRALLAATDTAEILARDGETFQGFPAANAPVQRAAAKASAPPGLGRVTEPMAVFRDRTSGSVGCAEGASGDAGGRKAVGESPAVSTSEPLGRWEETRCRR
jgi:hypothetical protein